MKKNLLRAGITLLLSVPIIVHAQNGVTSAFPGYVGDIRGQAAGGQDIVFVNTVFADQYLFKGKVCNGPKIAIGWENFDQSGSQQNCLFGFVSQTNPLLAFGNTKDINGNFYPFVSFNSGYTIATPLRKFPYSGSNAANMQISGSALIDPDIIETWNNSNIPQENFGVPIDFVGHMILSTGNVVSKGNLRPYLNGLVGTPRHYFTFRASNGKIFRSIYGTNIGSPTGQPAHKMYVETSPGVFVDLNIDNTVGTYCNGIAEYGGFVYVGYSASSPAFPLTAGLIKIDINTLAVSGCGGGFGITPTQVISDGLGNIYISGSPKVSGPTGAVLLKYNIASGTYTNLSNGLYTNQGAGSVISSIAIPPSCPTCLSVVGNMKTAANGGTGNTLSNINDVARSCPLAVVPITLKSFTTSLQNNDAVISWVLETTDPGAKFQLERSINGINFNSIYNEIDQVGNKMNFNHIDKSLPEGVYFYRLSMTDKNGKVTNSGIQKITIRKNGGVNISPNPIQKNMGLRITSVERIKSVTVVSLSGEIMKQVVANSNMIFLQIPSTVSPGTYLFKIELPSGYVIQKAIIF